MWINCTARTTEEEEEEEEETRLKGQSHRCLRESTRKECKQNRTESRVFESIDRRSRISLIPLEEEEEGGVSLGKNLSCRGELETRVHKNFGLEESLSKVRVICLLYYIIFCLPRGNTTIKRNAMQCNHDNKVNSKRSDTNSFHAHTYYARTHDLYNKTCCRRCLDNQNYHKTVITS
jgi:hypothetical protein